MPPRPSSEERELLSLYRRAGHGEHNIGEFFRERPELAARLGLVELDQDDAALALQLAPAVGKSKRWLARNQNGERADRAERAARDLASSARHGLERVELAPRILLGDLLADSTKKYLGFELAGVRVLMNRQVLLRARVALRPFSDLTATIDERGLHLAWRHGRGGLNFRPQLHERGATVLVVDLRTPARRIADVVRPGPVRLAEVLTGLGFV